MSENWIVIIKKNKEKNTVQGSSWNKVKNRKILCSIMEADPFFHFYSNGDVLDGGRNEFFDD